jgi:hypothetical protein
MKKTVILFVIVFGLTVGTITSASAWETPGPFKINAIYMSNANNYHFRVYSSTPYWHCSGGPTAGGAWSYINENDDGAAGKIKTLQLAYAMGKTVQLYTQGVAHSSGQVYCRIVEFIIY